MLEAKSGLAISEIECRRVGLKAPAWVVVDEWNEDDLATSLDLASTKPLGSFGAAFVREVRLAAIDAIKSGQHRRIMRER